MLQINEIFKIGETVRLRSGGPLMTVELVKGEYVDCAWFEGKTMRREIFNQSTIERSTHPPVTFNLGR